jgi:ABC-type multidrug transport system fused ATPase/permease subunit
MRNRLSFFDRKIPLHYIDEVPKDNWINFFLYLLKRYKVPFILISLTSFASLAELFLITNMLENFTTWFSQVPNYPTLIKLGKNLFRLSLVYVLIEGCGRLGNYISSLFVPLFESSTRTLFSRIIIQQSYEFFINKGEGEIVNKVQDFTDGLSDIFEFLSGRIVPSIAQFLISCYLIGTRSMHYLYLLLLWLFTTSIVCFYLSRKCAERAKETFLAQSNLSKIIVDLFSNIFIVKSFRTEDYEINYFSKAQTDESNKYHQFLLNVNFIKMIFSILYIILQVGLGNFFLLYCWYCNLITPADVVFLFSTASMATYVVWSVFAELPTMFTAIGQCKSSFTILQEINKIQKSSTILKDAVNQNTNHLNNFNAMEPLPQGEQYRMSGEIEFCNVSYGDILKNVSFKVEKGKKIGIVGSSGAGKSTLINLLLRILSPTDGKIIMNGEDLSNFTEDIVKNNIGIVTQDSLMFDRSIAGNIDFGENFSRDTIISALKKVHMDSFVDSKEEKENFLVGNKGRKLSGGQKQRINIARVMIRNPSIIICDEAGSSLDPVTEQEIIKNIFLLYENQTVIFVTHNLSMTQKLDLVLCLDKGQVVEYDTPENLKNKAGLYATMLKNEQIIGT